MQPFRKHRSAVLASLMLATSVGSGAAWAAIELEDGLIRPGNIPHSYRFRDQAFADEAQLIVPCTPPQCATPYTDASHTVRIPVEQAVIGNPPFHTGVENLNGVLEFRFTDVTPSNAAGPDVVVFLYATQETFQISARTPGGSDTAFVTIPATPFVQFPKIDETAGPCTSSSEASCALFQRTLLLAYEIDLDALGLPADAVVEAVRLQAVPGAQYPEIARVAALALESDACAALPGVERARCRVAQAGDPAVCTDPLFAALERLLRKSTTKIIAFLDRALAGPNAARVRKLLTKADRKLARLERKLQAQRFVTNVPAECRATLAELIAEARAIIQSVLASG
jgi:hypothetical protein